MKPRRGDLLLGSVAIAILALFVVTFRFIHTVSEAPMRKIVVHFRHDEGVAPVKPGSPVMLGGAMQVGKVTRIDRIMPRPRQAPDERPPTLTIVVEAEVEEILTLYRDVQITSDQGFVGGMGILLILSVGTPGPGRELGDAPIQGLPPVSFAATMGQLSRRLLSPGGFVDKLDSAIDGSVENSLMNKTLAILDDIKNLTSTLNREMQPGEQQNLMSRVYRIADDLASLSGALRREADASDNAMLLAKIHAALDQISLGLQSATGMLDESRPVVRNTLAGVENAVRMLEHEMLPAVSAELRREDPAALLGKIHEGMDRVNVSLENLAVTTDTARRIVVVNRPATEKIITNLKDSSDQIRTGVQELILNPWRFFGPGPEGQQKLDAFQAARSFAEAAVSLDSAAARLEAMLAAAPAGESVEVKSEVVEIQKELRATFDRFRRAEQFLWEKMK